ncbi:hypothetical protein HK102_002068, partial [Quaeritorhiza haematococci]
LINKTVLIICYNYTEDKRNAFISVEIILFSFLATYVYFFLPFFHQQINVIKFIIFTELVFTTIMSLIVNNIRAPEYAVIYTCVWAIMSVPVGVGSYYLISSHQKNAVSGLYHMIMDHPSRPPLPSPSKEQEQRLEEGLHGSQRELVIDEELYAFAKLCLAESKFLTYHQVEISTRFIKTFTQPSDLTIALAIYDCGLGSYMGKTFVWDFSLKKAAELDPNPMAEFFIYQQKGELRVRAESKATGKEMSMVDSMELTHMIRQAKRCHKQAASEIVNFWRLMSANKVDENRLQRVVSKITYLEQTGLKIFETLRSAYPKDTRIITMYAKFCDDIVKNFKKANALYATAAQLQPEPTIMIGAGQSLVQQKGPGQPEEGRHDGGNSSQGSNGSAILHAPRTHNSKLLVHQVQSQLSSQSNMSGVQVPGRSGTYTRKEIRAWINYRGQVAKLKQDSNRWSILAIGIIMIVLVSVSIGQAVWVISVETGAQYTVHQIQAGSLRREWTTELADETRRIPAVYQQNQTDLIEEFFQEMEEDLIEFEQIQFYEFFSQSESTSSFNFWLDPNASFFKNIVVWRGWGNGWGPNPLNQFDASSEFWRHQRGVMNMDPEYFRNGSYKFHESFRFVMDNFAFTYGDGYNLTTTAFTLERENEIRMVLLYTWVAFGAVCGVLILIGLSIFRPMLDRTVAIRNKNLSIVLQITQEMASGILAQIQAQRLASQVNTSDDDEDDDDDGDNNGMSRGVSSASTKVLYAKLTFIYAMTLMTIAGVFAIAVGMNFVYLTSLMQWGRRVDLTLQLRSLVRSIAYTAHEISHLDDFIYIPPPWLEKHNMTIDDYMQLNSTRNMAVYHDFMQWQIMQGLEKFNDVQLILLFGNPSRGIPRGRLPRELSEAMFVRRYPYANFNRSTDEFVNMFLEDMYAILEKSKREYVPGDSRNVARIRDIYLDMIDGFSRAVEINEKLFDERANTLRTVCLLLMSILIVIVIFIYFFVLRRFIEYLKTAGAESTKLLLLIPPEVAQRNFDLQVMLRGREEAIYYFQENNIELPKEALGNQHESRIQKISNFVGKRRGSSTGSEAIAKAVAARKASMDASKISAVSAAVTAKRHGPPTSTSLFTTMSSKSLELLVPNKTHESSHPNPTTKSTLGSLARRIMRSTELLAHRSRAGSQSSLSEPEKDLEAEGAREIDSSANAHHDRRVSLNSSMDHRRINFAEKDNERPLKLSSSSRNSAADGLAPIPRLSSRNLSVSFSEDISSKARDSGASSEDESSQDTDADRKPAVTDDDCDDGN